LIQTTNIFYLYIYTKIFSNYLLFPPQILVVSNFDEFRRMLMSLHQYDRFATALCTWCKKLVQDL